MNEPRDLDTLLAIVRQQEAERSGSEASQVAAIRILANSGAGAALPIQDLITRYGVSKHTIAALVDDQLHTDRRRKVRARIGDVDGEPIIWLTASGHQAAGKSRGKRNTANQ